MRRFTNFKMRYFSIGKLAWLCTAERYERGHTSFGLLECIALLGSNGNAGCRRDSMRFDKISFIAAMKSARVRVNAQKVFH